MFNNIKQFFFPFLLFVFVFSDISLKSQSFYIDTDSLIQWISQYPSNSKNTSKTSFTKKLGDFILGENEDLRLIKPMAVAAISPDTFFVIDQEAGVPFVIRNQQLEKIKSVKRKNHFFPSLIDMCFFKDQEILFTDSKLNKIYRIKPDQKNVEVFNDSLDLNQPTGIIYVEAKKEIWVVETAAHRISVLNIKGELIKHIGKRGTGNAEFNFPTALCVDKEGTIYVVDAMNFRIQLFNNEGQYLSSFGKHGDGSGYFARPKGIAIDSHHNIYVSDALFHTVQIFNKEGDFLYNFGGQGRESVQFWMPAGIFIDKNDYIYIADSYNSRVQIFKINISNTDE